MLVLRDPQLSGPSQTWNVETRAFSSAALFDVNRVSCYFLHP